MEGRCAKATLVLENDAAVGEQFFDLTYAPLIEARLQQSWDAADREIQLTHRGTYAEYNLHYDRCTRVGL